MFTLALQIMNKSCVKSLDTVIVANDGNVSVNLNEFIARLIKTVQRKDGYNVITLPPGITKRQIEKFIEDTDTGDPNFDNEAMIVEDSDHVLVDNELTLTADSDDYDSEGELLRKEASNNDIRFIYLFRTSEIE